MFLAKIAQGRTLKEFSLFNFVLPGLFGMLWFAIFGGAAIYMEAGGAGIYESMASLGTEAAVFAFFNNLPLSKILSVVFMITAFLSVVTLCESMTTTVASITLTGEDVASGGAPRQNQDLLGRGHGGAGLCQHPGGRHHRQHLRHQRHQAAGHHLRLPLLFVVAAMAISCFKLLGGYHEKDASAEAKEKSVR